MVRRINLKRANVARSNTIRDINRQIILNYVREEGPISRADIARITDLQRSTVSLIVEELLGFGLIKEIYGESSGGRPPLLLSLHTAHAVAIGVDLGKKRTIVATTDLAGRLLEQKEFPTNHDFEKTVSQIIDCIKYFIKKNGDSIEAIGISLPGLVEAQSGQVYSIPHLGWRHPPIVERIREAIELPVKIENDANAAALAELWFGRTEIRKVRDFILVLIENGIGTGVVFDGQIYHGKAGVAGEFGHMTIGANAPVACSAGSFDCWEAFASERAALARYRNLTKQKEKDKITFAQLVQLALEGESKAVAALRETAKYIGLGISNLTQGLSPEVTVVSGTIVRAWSLVAGDIKNAAESRICQGYPSTNIMPSTLGVYPTLLGAFSLILANKFSLVHTL